MNNAGPSTYKKRFDFTQPPPGYSIQGSGVSKNYESTPVTETKAAHYITVNKAITSCKTKNEPPSAIDSKFAYYPATSGNTRVPNKSSLTVSSGNTRPESLYGNHLPDLEHNTPIDPRIYALPPPPPPPPDPYPGNMMGHYVFNPAIYTTYSVPPPTFAGSIGAGQYVTYQQEIYHPPQYQREYNMRFSNRGGYYNHNTKKRKTPQDVDTDGSKKTPRKKKKPLSQNIPSRKDWSVEEARKALEVEKEFNKRHKSQHLIIKFPDLELNRDIVSKFHPHIDSVHFQQPSTPRFCFVTLKESSNMEEVIKELNKIKFGDGYLTAEPKKDREEDFNIGPEDIDPLNLYVGNLAQEVTVDDVIKAYPKNKRIDIGFAKKMKYTRYAFVCFRTVDDAIEAFQNTHATEMYSKSLIVRFRRLHGTVGLPGEPKPQNHQKRNESGNSLTEPTENADEADSVKDNNVSFNYPLQLKEEEPKNFSPSYASDDQEDEDELNYSHNIRDLVVNSLGSHAVVSIKNEPLDSDHESNESLDEKPHLPVLEIKTEPDVKPIIKIKDEKQDWDEKDSYGSASLSMRRRCSSDSLNDEDLEDYNDPLYGAFARATRGYKEVPPKTLM